MKLEDGRYLNDRLATYIIPTVKDAPRMDVEMLENPWEGGPFGAKGIGELPMDGAAPAVAAAVENATGVFATDVPATPEKLFAWEERGQVAASMRRRPRRPRAKGEVKP
jgi:CO/xanthine dehydrogenase Mo-binding subunit